jgi:choline dehydrogenase-like flavoprotein
VLTDARTQPAGDELETDVCIVGGGPAGMTLARELGRSGVRVCLLESGGVEHEAESQALYRGRVVGQRYFTLDESRVRRLGGATNRWGGWCRAMDPIDFEPRDWVAASGWPISWADVDRYSERTRAILHIPTDREAMQQATGPGGRRVLPLAPERFETGLLQFSPLVDFAAAYRDDLFAAPTVHTVLHANVTSIERDPDGSAVHRVGVTTLDRTQFTVRARAFVLAAGAIENARLLLTSNIGNGHDNVGRYFGEHPHVRCGVLEVAPGVDVAFYDEAQRRGRDPMAWFVAPAAVQRARRLLTFSASLRQRPPVPIEWLVSTQTPAYLSAKALLEASLFGRGPAQYARRLGRAVAGLADVARGTAARASRASLRGRLFEIKVRSEQVPNRESRVRLNGERDRIGQSMVDLDWRTTDQDRVSVREHARLLGDALTAAGIGRVVFPRDLDDVPWIDGIGGGWHQMGTTRMAHDPASGVVDEQCRVHGVPNLYVAGSAVFPTYGFANPTFTIIALSLRLADHVAARLSVPPVRVAAAPILP